MFSELLFSSLVLIASPGESYLDNSWSISDLEATELVAAARPLQGPPIRNEGQQVVSNSCQDSINHCLSKHDYNYQRACACLADKPGFKGCKYTWILPGSGGPGVCDLESGGDECPTRPNNKSLPACPNTPSQ